MKKKITNEQAIQIFEKWFLENQEKVFTSMPVKYHITIDDDEIMIHGEFENGDKDFSGYGNKYQWLYENNFLKLQS